MRRFALGKHAAMGVGAALSFALAATLLLLAHDVLRWREAMPAGDVRYRVSPEASDSWQPDTLLPFGAARELLDVGDDVEFRFAVRAFRLARLEDTTVSDPELALLRNAAEARLEAIATGAGDRRRRSRAAGLLGALGLARVATETEDRIPLIESTIASLQLALDPENDEAKFNLEVALQRSRGLQLTEASGGENPTPGGAGSKGAGTGNPGTGY